MNEGVINNNIIPRTLILILPVAAISPVVSPPHKLPDGVLEGVAPAREYPLLDPFVDPL